MLANEAKHFKYFGVSVSLWIFVYDIIFLFLMLRDRKRNYLPFINLTY